MDRSTVEFVAAEPGARRMVRDRRVRLGDTTPSGRLRLDALARYLQDIATDDADEAGLDGSWVTRRVVLALHELPRYSERVELTTFCSGSGPRWAERRTDVRVGERLAVEASAVWVYLDRDGQTAPLPDRIFELYGEAAHRRVSGRLRLGRPGAEVEERPWPLRRTDFDVLDHVNNAIALAAVEDELATRPGRRALASAEVEYRAAIDPGDEPRLQSEWGSSTLACWLRVDGDVRVATRVEW